MEGSPSRTRLALRWLSVVPGIAMLGGYVYIAQSRAWRSPVHGTNSTPILKDPRVLDEQTDAAAVAENHVVAQAITPQAPGNDSGLVRTANTVESQDVESSPSILSASKTTDNRTESKSLGAATVNHTGSVTNSGTGSGAVKISDLIGTNVTGVVQNSTKSQLTLSGSKSSMLKFSVVAGTLFPAEPRGTLRVPINEGKPNAGGAEIRTPPPLMPRQVEVTRIPEKHPALKLPEVEVDVQEKSPLSDSSEFGAIQLRIPRARQSPPAVSLAFSISESGSVEFAGFDAEDVKLTTWGSALRAAIRSGAVQTTQFLRVDIEDNKDLVPTEPAWQTDGHSLGKSAFVLRIKPSLELKPAKTPDRSRWYSQPVTLPAGPTLMLSSKGGVISVLPLPLPSK